MRRFFLVPGIAIVMMPFYLATASKLVDHDVFAMAEVSQLVIDGHPLYQSAWDNKPPLCLLVYAVPQWILRGSYPALQLELLVIVSLQAALFWWLLDDRPLWYRLTSVLMIFLIPLQNFDFVWSSSEDTANLLALPMLLGAYKILRSDRVSALACVAMGISLVLAFHARQTTVLYGVLPAMAVLTCRDTVTSKVRGTLLGLAGAGLGILGIVALILTVGDWNGYVHTVFVAPRQYGGEIWNAVQGIFGMRNNTLVFLFFASMVAILYRGPHRAFFLVVAIVAIGVILLPKKPFPHYWEQLTPFLCLMVPEAMERWTGNETPRVGMAAVLTYLAFNAVMTCGYMGLVNTNLPGHHSRKQFDVVAEKIRRASDPNDTLFVVGPQSAYLHFVTDLKPIDTLFWDFFLRGGMLDLSGANPSDVFAKIRSYPPDLLVIDRATESTVREGRSTGGRAEYETMLGQMIHDPGYHLVDETPLFRIYKHAPQ